MSVLHIRRGAAGPVVNQRCSVVGTDVDLNRDGVSGSWLILGFAAGSPWGLACGTEVPLLSLSIRYSRLLWDILSDHFFFRIRCGQIGEVPASPS